MIDMTILGGVVAAFATGTLSVSRPAPVVIVNGRRIDGVFSAVSGITGSVWPIAGDSISVDEAGRGQDNAVEIYSNQELQIASDDQPGDRITHGGIVYEVISRQPWTRGAFFVYTGQDIDHP
jgi:hypothetical protein